MRGRKSTGVCAAFLWAVLAASPAAADKYDDCVLGADLRRSIAVCTAIIEDGSESRQFRALAYSSRGLAYYRLKQYRRAIEDYDALIRLEPDNALAYASRGRAYEALKQYPQAIRDFRAALAIDPNNEISKAGLKRLGVAP